MDEIAAREAAGQSVWCTDFDERALVRIAEFWRLLEQHFDSHHDYMSNEVARYLRAQSGRRIMNVQAEDFHKTAQDTDLVLDILGAVYLTVENRDHSGEGHAKNFADVVNMVLREHRIAYKLGAAPAE